MWPVTGRGGSATPQINKYYLSKASKAIGMGAPVTMEAAGLVSRAISTSSNIVGVSAEFKTSATSTTRKTIMVFDDPHQIFEIQSDGSFKADASYLGMHTSFANASTYNVTHGQSKCVFDQSLADRDLQSAAIDHQIQVVGISDVVGRNDASRSFVGLLVKFTPSKHLYLKTTAHGEA
jgi:hypothetical protein